MVNIVKLFLFILLIFSCFKYKVLIKVEPEDAVIVMDNVNVKANSVFKTDKKKIDIIVHRDGYEDYITTFENVNSFKKNIYYINLKKKKFNITFSTIDNKSKILIDNKEEKDLPLKILLEYGRHSITLQQRDYTDQKFEIEITSEKEYKFRHQREVISDEIKLTPIGIIECGKQPKQVSFSLHDKYVFISLLDGEGFEVLDVEELAIIKKIKVPFSEKKGYVEGLFINKYKTFFISQMTTGNIYEFDVSSDIKYLRTIYSHGSWSKFIAYCEKKDLLAVSNWISNDISVIEYKTGDLIKKIENIIVPRGISFSNDGDYLYACSFEGGQIIRYSTNDWQQKDVIYIKGVPRHIVLDSKNTLAYVSDMACGVVYEIDTSTFKILNTIKVYYNPNTIDITPDDSYLFVSNRGPNNPNGYLKRSLKNGEISIINCKTKKIIGRIEGGTQPTGLDVSNNGKLLAFSNFQDNTVEIYRIEY